MNNIHEFTVQNLNVPTRVDLYLISQIAELTRTSAKKIIMEGFVLVNGEKVKPNFRVFNDFKVSIDVKKSDDLLNKEEFSKLVPTEMKLDFIYEDTNLIVLNKKEGEVVHPVTGHVTDTLMNGLLFREIKLSKDGNKTEVNRIRPIHRLDKDTSGVILFSKNKEAHEYYSKIFENREVEKTYYAIVKGDFRDYMESKTKKEYFEIFTYIGRSNENRKQFYNTNQEKGLPARTKVYFEKYWQHPVKKGKIYSLLKLVPETGRTHQLRVHLNGVGFPIVGDTLYEGDNFSRLMLHAYSLKLKTFPKNKNSEFTAALPKEFGKK